jgi:hypothetical protein
MAVIQTCEVGATLAPLNIVYEVLYDDRCLKNLQFLLRCILRDWEWLNRTVLMQGW